MKKRNCCYERCGSRRAHHERPDEERGVQQVEVPDDYADTLQVYCSLECKMLQLATDPTSWLVD